EQGGSAVINGITDFFNTYILIVGKEEENRKLLHQIKKLEQDKNKYTETELENERLRNILKLTSERPDEITVAEVFARDPSNWFNVLWINKGSGDGVAKDMVAVTPLGPVGKIHRIFDDGASIILLTDVNSSVAVRLQSTRVVGILEGRGDGTCSLKYVSKRVEVKVGEQVVTSGLDGIFPDGLFVGYVSEVKKEEGEMFQLIQVLPAQDLNAIEEVVILKR
ncbi:MAG TPA: rod shape-determining protein MreC, partial [Nitrospirae bacterium]|nr:rod shape-determining protein MreC [Nitrospirota bacterium]HEW81283.1 rod shape-determining protein MreC [Nitrospirota bacterium]